MKPRTGLIGILQPIWQKWLLGATVLLAGSFAILSVTSCTQGATTTPAASPTKPAAASAQPSVATAPAATPSAKEKASPAPETKLANQVTINVGYVPLISAGPLFVAVGKGYFDQQNIKVNMVKFASGAEMIPALSKCDLDAAYGGISPGLFNSYARDVKTIIVADGGTIKPGYGVNILMVRKDLADSGAIKSIKDLKGRKVSGATLGSPLDYFLRNALGANGMSLKDLDLVRLSSADVKVGFQNKGIDAAVATEPFPTNAEALGLAKKWMMADQFVSGNQFAAILYSESMTKKKDVANAFMVAYLKGARDYIKGVKSDEAVLNILNKWTTVPVQEIKASIPAFIDPNGSINIADIQKQQAFWAHEGVVKESVDLKPFVDTSYIENAVKVLGEAQ